jgi:hypothetical protein
MAPAPATKGHADPIEFWPNGTDQALIRRVKTDAEGQGESGQTPALVGALRLTPRGA